MSKYITFESQTIIQKSQNDLPFGTEGVVLKVVLQKSIQ